MRHYDTTFFCDEGKVGKARLEPLPDPGDSFWPISVTFREDNSYKNSVVFHFANESDFIAFKNSVLETYNEYRRFMGYDAARDDQPQTMWTKHIAERGK